MTACPFAPPMPELVIATSAGRVNERTLRGSISVGTRKRNSSQWIAGFGVTKLTLGGMSPVSKMPQTLQSDARKAVISRWLYCFCVSHKSNIQHQPIPC